MDPTETTGAESALKVEVGETVNALLPTLMGEGLVCKSRVIYALPPFATLASALGGNGTAMLGVCMRCGGKSEGRERLLRLRFLVTVSEMAKFVCHAPDHYQGLETGKVEEERGERSASRKEEGKAEIGTSIYIVQLQPAVVPLFSFTTNRHFPFGFNDTRQRQSYDPLIKFLTPGNDSLSN